MVRPAPPGPPGLVNTAVFAVPFFGSMRLTAMVMVLPLFGLFQSIGAVKLPHCSRSTPGGKPGGTGLKHCCHLISWSARRVWACAGGATNSDVAMTAASADAVALLRIS